MKRKLLFLVLALVLCLDVTVPTMASGTDMVNSPSTVGAGGDHSGLIDENGSLWMWGDNYYGQLGNDGGGNVKTKWGDFYQTVPIKVLDSVISVSSSGRNTAAIKADGSLWMWGENYDGQFGNGSKKGSLVPLKVMDNVAAVSLGGGSVTSSYAAAIKTDGSLWMWGVNDYGQLGNGTTKNSLVPVKVMDNVASVSLSKSRYVAAIKTDGSLWMWGDNANGQLGNGYVGNQKYHDGFDFVLKQNIPVKVMDNVASVSLGFMHTAAVKTDGSLWTWGFNEGGRLGNGLKGTKNIIEPLKVMDSVASVSCGSSHTAVVKTDSSLWMFGDNGMGQLGIGYTGNQKINIGQGDFPVQTVPIKVLDNVAAVSCGSYHTIIVKTDGSVWAFGRNGNGELGNGGTNNGVDIYNYPMQTTPVNISRLTARLKLPTAYYDVNANAYYTKSVIWAIEEGITSGTSKTMFSPDKVCSTGEVLTLLWKAQNSPEPTTSNPFSDVTESHYYYKAALWAYEKGLVSGSTFKASVPSTRSMTVTYLWRLAGKPTSGASSYADVSSSADYAQAVSWAVGKGIATGTEKNNFSPDSTCTRGQTVTFLYRAFAQ
ncbi:alpha-tubulin suppressor-like RCC1 family protein [Fontibacillus solani]|uniref:Alpha-tubulin suppressor-like RCC1 family protein n=1 Tax=Fontibacillus solani TaxID=1572857 RepID=A0A7W3SS54_9BACL|nr:S-layer homology domain-containing protein [Fontibacillus solani]MBA9085094.1 alpha-tubulin suppressor-like RCC1 family protein [Fontibacillus solani]